jgi:hypothetical protein
MTAPTGITPDTKDWTWVLTRTCDECGFDAAALDRSQLGARLLEATQALGAVLTAPDVRLRPAPDTWSPLEYAAHVRDACRVFAERLHLMLTVDAPAFANWDQDATALAADYASLDPATVAVQLRADSITLAAAFDAVPHDAWTRTGTRSDGAVFTVESLGRYLVHDPVHHVHDVFRAR